MNLEVKSICKGFVVEKIEKIEDINGEGITFRHQKTGARLFFLKNQDTNKVFNITFATPPIDDCGTPHILEHSVLCGSKNYPARESFIELAKSSLKTFINAFTFSDKTMYPVASMNYRDFMNLVTVYMDAVFQPSLLEKEDIFQQEGWHYETDSEGNLVYQGVVYNEMRGVYSSPDALLRRKIQDYLFPDTCYGKESGGDPDFIPELTFEGFKSFYKEHYVPENSMIFLYGKLAEEELEGTLALLNNKLLEGSSDTNISPVTFEKQKAFEEKKVFRFAVPAEEESSEKGYYGFGWCISETLNSELAFSMDVLTHILAGTPSSPLKRSLVEQGIGRDVTLSHDSGIFQPTLALCVKGGKKDRLDEVELAIRNCLEDLVKNGIEPDLLEASMNFVEFQFREADFGGYPKGLIYGLQIAETWLYGGDPTERLRFENRIKNVRNAMHEGYFEALIKKYILENNHAVSIELYEESGLSLKNNEKQLKKLSDIKNCLGEEAFREIEKTAVRLREIQIKGDDPEKLNKLPLLKLNEISTENTEKKRRTLEQNLFITDLDTAGIAYAATYYNGNFDDVKVHPGFGKIATEMLGSVNANSVDYGTIQRQILKDTGGLDFGSGVFAKNEKSSSFIPYFNLKTRCLNIKTEDTGKLVEEIIRGTEANADQRFFQIIGELITRMETSLTQESHSFVIMKMASRLFSWGKYLDQIRGMELYALLKRINNKEIEIPEIEAGIKVALNCYKKSPLLTSVAGGFGEKRIPWIMADTTEMRKPIDLDSFVPEKVREAYYTNGRVNYCGLGFDYSKTGMLYNGNMRVLSSVLRYGYLWNEIRVKGGAYGAFFNIDRTGFMSMASYRDPRVGGTLTDFRKAAGYLEKFSPTEEEMRKYIIGTISGFDLPRTNAAECDRTAEMNLKGITNEMLQQERDEILGTTPEMIRGYSELLREMGEQGNVMVIGQKEILDQEAKSFDVLSSLMG